jgi:hypothetical protein
MKQLFIILCILIASIGILNTATSKQNMNKQSSKSKTSLKVRYYLTDENHNPTVNFMQGETYNVYLSIQNMTQDSIIYKQNSYPTPLFHFIALKSANEDVSPRFNNQNESLQIPVYADQDTVLGSYEIIDGYQQVEFYSPGFYTIQIMPNVVFPEKFKKDWGSLSFEIECHPNPKTDSQSVQDLFDNGNIGPLLDKILKSEDLNDYGQ